VFEDQWIWLTAAVVVELPTAERERIRQEEYAHSSARDALHIVDEVLLRALAVDAESGRLAADLSLLRVKRPRPVHSLNSYASPTPVVSDGRLYCHFGSNGTVCLDCRTHKIVWTQRLPHDEGVGAGSSPVLDRQLLIIPCDGMDEQYVVGLDAADGHLVWRTDRPEMAGRDGDFHKAFSTPLVIEHRGQRQALIMGAQWLVSYDPATGRELWRLRYGNGFSNAPRPVYGHGLVYVCTGFLRPQLLAVDPSGEGDVSGTNVRWSYKGQVPSMSSPILVGSELFFVSDNGIATCLDARTGELRWRERLGGNFSSSPICAAGQILIGSREGRSSIFRAAAEFELLAVNQLDGAIMASPAVYDTDLLIRTDTHLYRIGMQP
jgi:hypothetical protein